MLPPRLTFALLSRAHASPSFFKTVQNQVECAEADSVAQLFLHAQTENGLFGSVMKNVKTDQS